MFVNAQILKVRRCLTARGRSAFLTACYVIVRPLSLVDAVLLDCEPDHHGGPFGNMM